MRITDHGGLKVKTETDGRYYMDEMHLFDENASEEDVSCGVDAAPYYRRGVREYLQDRLHGAQVGTICDACKAQAVPFAVIEARELEAEGELDEAEEYWQLAETLAREAGQNPPCR